MKFLANPTHCWTHVPICAVFVLVFLGQVPALLLAQHDGEWARFQFKDLELSTPAGLSVQRVATSPLVERPIVATWDEQGRLVVLESAGPIDVEAERNGSRPHRLVRLVDDDADGVFDRRIVAAENLSFPEGVLCVGNSTLVSAPPQIWRLIDEDGDGVCEQREVWFDGGTWTHCYNDLHGPYLGPDGWIYWCKGAFAQQSQAVFNGKPLVSSAAHILRRRLEGGPVEAVMTGGMDNPVEVAFNQEGERFFTSTFVQFPAGGRRDGIVHAIYGGVYGKRHDPILEHLRTGPLMPIMTHLGPAAPSGLLALNNSALRRDSALFSETDSVEASQFLVSALFNLQAVRVHQLVRDGATFRTEDRDLLRANRVDFHPTDVLEDADGSLLVIDTGGWYDLCCPSSALDQATALGGIYRIRSPACDQFDDPRGLQLDWLSIDAQQVVIRLANPSWWIRRHAQRWLVANAPQSENELIRFLQLGTNPIDARLLALWCLCQLGTDAAESAIVNALDDPREPVRQAAAMAIAVRRWPAALPLARVIRSAADPATRRAAAEALGRVGDESSIQVLMDVISEPAVQSDRVLQHSVLFALMELDHPDLMVSYLDESNPRLRHAAMRVLSELKSDQLKPEYVFSAAANPDPQVRELAIEILAKNPQWSAALFQSFVDLWPRAIENSLDRAALLAIASGWQRESEFRVFLASKLSSADTHVSECELLLDVLERVRLSQLPDSWSKSLERFLSSEHPSNAMKRRLAHWLAGVDLDATSDQGLVAALAALAEAHARDLPLALDFARALPEQSQLSPQLTNALIESNASPQSALDDGLVAQTLTRLKLSRDQAKRLSDQLVSIHPAHLSSILAAIANVGDDVIDRVALERLTSVPGVRSVSPESLTELYRNRSPELQQLAAETVAALLAPPADIGRTLEKLDSQLPPGDALRGMDVFRSTTANCSVCHQVAYVGGSTGPDLSRIGSIRSRRELLEAIAYPNLRLEQSYRSVKLLMLDGRTFNGLVESEDAEVLDLVTGPNQRVRLPVADIDQRLSSDVSIMPSGMTDSLSRQQLADLIEFLQSRR